MPYDELRLDPGGRPAEDLVTKVVLLGLVVLASAAASAGSSQWLDAAHPRPVQRKFDRWKPGLFHTTPVTEAGRRPLCYAAGIWPAR